MANVTPSQTIGPFWHLLGETGDADLTRFGATGGRFELVGRVFDGDGAPVTDACVELWQDGPPASATFPGWGRCGTDPGGGFRFVTVLPGPEHPYFSVAVFARGLLRPLWTRVYFVEIGDDLLRALPPDRRATLLARSEPPVWRWDIRLQGAGETVFLDL